MSASMTLTKTPEGGHPGPPLGGLENLSSVTHETELRRLPADWRVVPLREAYSFTKKPRGLTIPLDDTIPFLPMDAIPIGRVSVSAFEERPSSKLTSGTYIENGDLLVAKITPSFENGKQAIVKWDRPFGFATTEVIPIQEIEGISDKHYLFHILLHPEIRADLAGKMNGTTGRQRLSKEVLGAKQIPLPPLPEQRKIAGVLGLVQRALEQQERLIALTTELKKALLHQLFTQGLRGEPQKQTEIGLVPESWQVVNLEHVTQIERGKFTHRPRNEPRFYGGQTPFVQTGDVSSCDGRIREYSQTLNEEGVLISKVFPAGTILITIAANIGFSGILEFDSACPDSLIGLTPNERIDIEFLQHYLTTQQPVMDRLAPRGTQKNINIQFLKPWLVPLPSSDEQSEIREALNAVDSKTRVVRRKHAALTALFRTLLHQLMTAQIRVDELDMNLLNEGENNAPVQN